MIVRQTATRNSALERLATACERQWLYLFGDGGVVYSQAQSCFVGLDAAGVTAYRAFEAGACLDDLYPVHDHLTIAEQRTLEIIHALSKGIFPEEHAREGRVGWSPIEGVTPANIQILGIPVFLDHPHDAIERLCCDCFQGCQATTRPARIHLQATRTTAGWEVSANGHALFSSVKDERIGLALLHAVRLILYAESPYDVAFHAAMVADESYGMMLCAPREAGKSTLAAHLVAQGFDLVTDEPALLSLDTGSISALDLPISLKEGSWDLLGKNWPQLASAAIHTRSDGKKIKLLHPHRERISDALQARQLTHILFPQYAPLSPAHIESLSPLQTLALLNEGGMLPAIHLDGHAFERFLKLMCSIPAYAVSYGSLAEADRMIRRVLR